MNGWYAPGVNLHRTAYTARNYEYYSEDAVISGKLAANLIAGAKVNGLYCYIKHFACSEAGPNPRAVNTWLTEQNLRENYLKPFEIAVKEGGANAVMTAFNRVGCVWAGANYAMNVEILRKEWGFKGSVLTDWTACASWDAYIGGMNVYQGLRGGNDIWLNPNNNASMGVRTNNAIDLICARNAAKNVLYTYIDTTLYAKKYDRTQLADRFKDITIEVRSADTLTAWWIPVLGMIEVLIVVGFGVWTFSLLRPKKSRRDEAIVIDNK